MEIIINNVISRTRVQEYSWYIYTHDRSISLTVLEVNNHLKIQIFMRIKIFRCGKIMIWNIF